MRIVAIVEGHGEVQAVPILIRRIAEVVSPGAVPEVPRPIRTRRQRLLKVGELERTVELAARQAGTDGRILILLDADRDCPRDLAGQILERTTAARADRTIRVVLAKVEYEAWFLAAAGSIAGCRGIGEDVTAPENPERIRDAKGWLSARMHAGRSYRETLDQPALTARIDLDLARRGGSLLRQAVARHERTASMSACAPVEARRALRLHMADQEPRSQPHGRRYDGEASAGFGDRLFAVPIRALWEST